MSEHLAAGHRWQDIDFVFATRHGRPSMAWNVLRGLYGHLDRASRPRQRFHDLRQFYATPLLESGENLAVISRTLGHANITTTANTYANLTPATLDRTAARMDDVLSRKRVSGA